MAVKARVVQIAVVPSRIHVDGGTSVEVEHLLAVDSDGNVHERFSNDEPGQWSEVPLPARAKRVARSTGTRRKK